MSGKNLLEGRTGPVTQSVEAVKVLLSFVGRSSDPLPQVVELSGGVRLTKSSKGDCYYVTTPKACSCPAAVYHPGQPCKHMKALLAGAGVEASRAQARAYQARKRELRGKAKAEAGSLPAPGDSLMPRGGFRPVVEVEDAVEREVSSKPLYVDLHDTTALDAAYWSIKEDREMWPAEA